MSASTSRTTFYFAYGSNADPERFRSRVGAWVSRRPAWLRDHRLRFSANVQSEGGGGAVVDPVDGDVVAGVLYEITEEQMAAMDREEFDPSRNATNAGRREQTIVMTEDASVVAQLYTVVDDGRSQTPSARYLQFILDGLTAVGHSNEVLDRVRKAALRATEA